MSPESPESRESGAEVPEVVALGDRVPPRALRRRVVDLLAAGRAVGLPTETVYGLAVRADREEALEHLRTLKGRPRELPLTWHVAERDAIDAFASLRPLARRLAERYWPGPLTLVLHGTPAGLDAIGFEGWTGLRLPAHRATRALLEAADFPVVASSANASGETPLTEAAAVARAFPELALVVDGGAARIGEASSVLKLGPGTFELLRPGLLTLADLRATAGLRIGFVCTGNTCRSPMAGGLARDLLARRLGGGEPAALEDFGFAVSSAGVAAGPGSPASAHALTVLEERGIDLTGHRSNAPTPESLAELDHVYAMTHSHLERLRELLPGKRARRCELLDPEGRDVPDPIGGPLEEYRRCADAILAAIERRAPDWA